MATSNDAKGFKQDMVVSIRYRNDLPPPPMPPKLLNIDTGGLSQYLTTSYASGLVKREEPNIEVDGEGGMPIDMVGVPGYFLGDESAIMAPDIQPVLDPADHALMMTVEQLKSAGAKNNVSFLRKTQYMTASQMARASNNNDPFVRATPRSRKVVESNKMVPPPIARDDPENIKRHIQKGFDIAYPDSVPFNPPEAKANPITPQERDAWKNPVHPDNPRLKPVGFYPILPDLDAMTDMAGNWQAVKFEKPPLPPYHGRRDDRVDVGLMMASENAPEMVKWKVKKAAFDKNPELYEDPGPEPYVWSLLVPKQVNAAPRIRKIFNDSDPQKDDPELYAPLLEESADGTQRLPFERVRVYQTSSQNHVDPRRVMGLSLVDADQLPPDSRFRKQGSAAYYYPILERLRMKADRANLTKAQQARHQAAEDEAAANIPDQLMVLFREAAANEKVARYQFRGEYDDSFADEYQEIVRAGEAEEEQARAQAILDEQGELHEGAQDVSMHEVADGEEADVTTNGVEHKDRDDDRNTPPPPVNAGDPAVQGQGHVEDDNQDEMRDD
ncbi:hypothetical protein HRR83_006147 [Exophiala dermatitidis]|uniref:Uncharacterized protein n=1 Tax=Exophiala dermatitidis TaxID=5970 RepID=A0AAN6ER79_EXODE|nr:hypothetical protein HRR75_005080 [Exophiala dermatitidis]KAJ4515079.1 hypothetical protein HRR74_005544 [Exophiala dermatitidis]KAJ4517570.1 hypothetical protein HRR73_004622 [Exophiala dermatitidis]KAJ4548669.1 hypothetical protein HRR76_001258 [Exophiala dermatitidis]KAJ4550481.1 hypothetical protein HRR78_004250 [Exophiala dermatitidis]